jgi:deoxyribodipyrimidine photo-lyase
MAGKSDQHLYQAALFIFRRDLRLCDNTGLIEAARASELVTPCFIVDPRQASQHPYFSSKAFGFMIRSLEDLAQQLSDAGAPLSIFEGQAEQVINSMNKRRAYDAIFLNKDYTHFSKKRDAAITAACKRRNVDFHFCSDALLHEPHEVVTSARAP